MLKKSDELWRRIWSDGKLTYRRIDASTVEMRLEEFNLDPVHSIVTKEYFRRFCEIITGMPTSVRSRKITSTITEFTLTY